MEPFTRLLLVRVCSLVFLGMFGLSFPVSAFFSTEPDFVGGDEPFRLVVSFVGSYLEPEGGFEPTVEVDGQEIVVRIQLLGFIGDPPGSFVFTTDVDPLPEGEYTVRVEAELDGEMLVLVEQPLTIGGSYVSMSIEPEFAVAGEPFELTIRGSAPAACSDEEPYVQDGVLVVPLYLDCSVVTPPPFPTPFEFVTPPLTLEEGVYPIVVSDPRFPFLIAYARGEIEVVPQPVRLHGGLFEVTAGWQDFEGQSGDGRPVRPPSDDSALFWFFGPDNWELMVKVLDACEINGKYWVLGAASTTVEYDVRITGPGAQVWTFSNPLGEPSEAFADVDAFDCVEVEPPSDPEPPQDLSPDNLFHLVTVEPGQAVPHLPVRAVIRGTTACCGKPGLERIERIGRTIRVHLEFAEGGILAFSSYQLSADLGFLDEGSWDLQFVGSPSGQGMVELARTTIEVTDDVETRTAPQLALSDEAVHLFVKGVGTCPSLELDEIVGRRIKTLWSPGGCLSPPGIHELSLDLGRLGAGTYEVEVRDYERRLIGGRLLEVLNAPVTVREGRFALDVAWKDFEGGEGRGRLVNPVSDDSALFWFFGPDNWELMVKVLDGCDINGHYWVFGAASSTVEYEVSIADTEHGGEWSFHNALGTASPAFADVEAFSCLGVEP
ncbi:MAG: hypothetical protein MPN21_03285 [Thermoanaerobaculia bacterium]|nr:hypothetical protein [Thermoanaerobaculia bacterium]